MNGVTLVGGGPKQVVERDFTLLKTIIIGLLGVAFMTGTGYYFSILNFTYAIPLVIAFSFLFVFQTIFIQSSKIDFLITFLEAIALAAPFYKNFSSYLLFATLIVFVVMISAALSARKEIDNTFRVPFSRVCRGILPSILTIVFVFVFAVYFGLAGNKFLSNKQVETVLGDAVVNPSLKIFMPKISNETSIDKVIAQLSEASINSLGGDALSGVPQTLKDSALNETSIGFVKTIEGFTGIKINLKDTLSGVIYNTAISKFNSLENDLKSVVVLGIIISVWFLFYWFFSFPLVYWSLSAVAYIIYQILLITGFAYLQIGTTNKETVVIK